MYGLYFFLLGRNKFFIELKSVWIILFKERVSVLENNDLYINQDQLVAFFKNNCEQLGKEISEEVIDLVLELEMEHLVEKGNSYRTIKSV